MRILLDESLPRKLSLELVGHQVQTVQKRGWSGLSNALLQLASQEFDVLITADRNLEFQQNTALRPLVPRLLNVLRDIRPAQLVHINLEG
jgi:hypothetical protein